MAMIAGFHTRLRRLAVVTVSLLTVTAVGLPTVGAAADSPTAAPVVSPAATPAGAANPFTTATVTGTIATGLAVPWGIGFLPDGTALVTERDSKKIIAISPKHRKTVIGTIGRARPGGEGGLLGLAVSTTFEKDRTVFVYFTARNDNRVAALKLNRAHTKIKSRKVILKGIPKEYTHNGGRILAAPDGTLYVSTGDARQESRVQDVTYLGGKILHMTAKGGPVAGHPFAKSPLVYSYGHRNVQGLAFDSKGRLWASEFGESRYDELNLIKRGGNYGWPIVEGPSKDKRFIAPYKYWPTSEASPSGLAIVNDTALLASLRGTRLWMVPLTGPKGKATPRAQLVGTLGRLRTVAVSPDGEIWLSTSNRDGRGSPTRNDDRIVRIRLGR